MKWCFDTSALIEPWVRLYPKDVFASLWDLLEVLAANGVIGSPAEVLTELERQKDDLHEWVSQFPDMFHEPDRAVMEQFTEIVNRYPTLMKVDSLRSGADPFVVALASVGGVPVVTYETMAKQNGASKIPNVCADMNVPCVQLVDVLRAENFRA